LSADAGATAPSAELPIESRSSFLRSINADTGARCSGRSG
jgi:hypothetical protein